MNMVRMYRNAIQIPYATASSATVSSWICERLGVKFPGASRRWETGRRFRASALALILDSTQWRTTSVHLSEIADYPPEQMAVTATVTIAVLQGTLQPEPIVHEL